MPDEMSYIITVQRMMTCDEADAVVQWSGIVTESKIRENFGALRRALDATEWAIKDFTGTNCRPMTDAEIEDYRQYLAAD